METKKTQGGKTPETGRENASSNKHTPNTRNETTSKSGSQRNEQPESGRDRDRDRDNQKR